jgi:hypothetical protein
VRRGGAIKNSMAKKSSPDYHTTPAGVSTAAPIAMGTVVFFVTGTWESNHTGCGGCDSTLVSLAKAAAATSRNQ